MSRFFLDPESMTATQTKRLGGSDGGAATTQGGLTAEGSAAPASSPALRAQDVQTAEIVRRLDVAINSMLEPADKAELPQYRATIRAMRRAHHRLQDHERAMAAKDAELRQMKIACDSMFDKCAELERKLAQPLHIAELEDGTPAGIPVPDSCSRWLQMGKDQYGFPFGETCNGAIVNRKCTRCGGCY